jgi:hypothetical protein
VRTGREIRATMHFIREHPAKQGAPLTPEQTEQLRLFMKEVRDDVFDWYNNALAVYPTETLEALQKDIPEDSLALAMDWPELPKARIRDVHLAGNTYPDVFVYAGDSRRSGYILGDGNLKGKPLAVWPVYRYGELNGPELYETRLESVIEPEWVKYYGGRERRPFVDLYILRAEILPEIVRWRVSEEEGGRVYRALTYYMKHLSAPAPDANINFGRSLMRYTPLKMMSQELYDVVKPYGEPAKRSSPYYKLRNYLHAAHFWPQVYEAVRREIRRPRWSLIFKP